MPSWMSPLGEIPPAPSFAGGGEIGDDQIASINECLDVLIFSQSKKRNITTSILILDFESINGLSKFIDEDLDLACEYILWKDKRDKIYAGVLKILRKILA